MHSLETPDTLTVCEPCQHCWVSMASVVLECSCSGPGLRIPMCTDPFIPLVYMVYQLKYDSVHGRFNGTIATSQEDPEEFFALKRDRNQGIQLPSAWKPLVPIFLNFCLGRTCKSQRRAPSNGFRSVPCCWYARVHGPWRRTQVHSSFQTTTSSRSARWQRSLTCCKCGIRRMAQEPHTPKLHRHSGNIKCGEKVVFGIISGNPFCAPSPFCFLWGCLFRHSFRHEKDTKV